MPWFERKLVDLYSRSSFSFFLNTGIYFIASYNVYEKKWNAWLKNDADLMECHFTRAIAQEVK